MQEYVVERTAVCAFLLNIVDWVAFPIGGPTVFTTLAKA
jgi:hypothetical protein